MHATRAYLASLGTTGLLVLAAFAILITASALLAFNGWPGEEATDRATPVLIDPGRELAPGTGPAQVAAEAAGAADDVAFVPASAEGDDDGGARDDDGDTGDDGGPRDGGPDGPGDGGPDDRTPDDGTPNTPADPSPPGGGGGDNPPPDNGGVDLPGGGTLLPNSDVSLTDGLADGVESATDFLGADTVSQVSPELGQVLTGTGQVLTDLVRALDGTPAPARR